MLWLCIFFTEPEPAPYIENYGAGSGAGTGARAGATEPEPEPRCIIEIEKRKTISYKMSLVPAYFFTELEPDWVSEGR